MVRCKQHGGYVPERSAQMIAWDDTGSGPGVATYACDPCIREHGLVPIAWTGRRDAAPTPPGSTT